MRKLVGLLLVFCLLSSLGYSQELVFYNIDWDKLDSNLMSVEEDLNMLRINNDYMSRQLETLEHQLAEQAKYSANLQIQLAKSETKLAKLESSISKWKTYSIISTVVIAGLTTGLVIAVR